MPASTSPQMGGVFDPTRDVTLSGGFTAPTAYLTWTTLDATATGATGTTATALPATTPCAVSVTGASGAGVALPLTACVPGAVYVIRNGSGTGVLNVYSVGATINGTTGTTAFAITATGNRGGIIFCVTAGAWMTVGAT